MGRFGVPQRSLTMNDSGGGKEKRAQSKAVQAEKGIDGRAMRKENPHWWVHADLPS